MKNIFIIMLFLFGIIPVRFAQSEVDSTQIEKVRIEILSKIDKCENKICSFHLTSASPVYDEKTKTKKMVRFVIIENKELMEICDKYDVSILNQAILPSLQLDEYSWTLNLLLFYINSLSGENLFEYMPDRVSDWELDMKEKHVIYWNNRLGYLPSK